MWSQRVDIFRQSMSASNFNHQAACHASQGKSKVPMAKSIHDSLFGGNDA
jgi:hypothetical protein